MTWILHELDTMRAVAAGASLARYNDGEFGYGWRGFAHRLQRLNRDLQRRLREVFAADEPGLLVGVPRIIPPDDDSLPVSTPGCQRFWGSWRKWCEKLYDRDRQYASAFVSYPDRHLPREQWAEFRDACDAIWADRDVVLVGSAADSGPGGRGDGVLSGMASYAWVETPGRGAWSVYPGTLTSAIQFPRDSLVLVATGVSGTVLAHDLHVAGFHAVDIGRLLIRLKQMEGLP